MHSDPGAEQQALYRHAFVRNCLCLILRGHVEMNRTGLREAEEPHITGELVSGVRALLEGDDPEPWMQDLEVLDDPPQDARGRHGKARPRIDIEFVRVIPGRRPRFHIEAKRLYRSDSVNEYFGSGGLQMFVDGAYALAWPSGGMLGYVQTDNCDTWIAKLKGGFVSRRKRLAVEREDAELTAASDFDDIPGVQVSVHKREGQADVIVIYHLLLEFL